MAYTSTNFDSKCNKYTTPSVEWNTSSMEEEHMTENEIIKLPSVQSLLENGYRKGIVLKAFNVKCKETPLEFLRAEDLLRVIWALEEAETKGEFIKFYRKSKDISNDVFNTIASTNANFGAEKKDAIKRLREENRWLKERLTCKICMDNPICIVFLPCGHLATCTNCASMMRICPMCRRYIEESLKVKFC